MTKEIKISDKVALLEEIAALEALKIKNKIQVKSHLLKEDEQKLANQYSEKHGMEE